jgi:Leucine-rich repeat (LRR) protein
MKNLLLLHLAFPMFCFGQIVNIPDANFKAYLVGNININTNGDREIQVSEASAFNGSIRCIHNNITNLKGIEAFTALTQLLCSYNQLTRLDVSKNTALTDLECGGNQLKRLDVRKNTSLTELWCTDNQLISLDVSKNTALTSLNCWGNELTSLNISKNTALTELWCGGNQFDCAALISKYGIENPDDPNY